VQALVQIDRCILAFGWFLNFGTPPQKLPVNTFTADNVQIKE